MKRELLLSFSPLLLVGMYMISKKSLFVTGCIFLAFSSLVIFIIFLAFGGNELVSRSKPSKELHPSAQDDNIFTDAIQIDSVLETAECIKLLQMTKKRLLKADHVIGDYTSKLLVNHHFMQNILNILELCPIDEDERYKSALDLLVLLLCESSSQSEYFQSTAVIDDLKRLLLCFMSLAEYKDSCTTSAFSSKMADKLCIAALRCLAAIAINCPDYRDYLTNCNAIFIAKRLASIPDKASRGGDKVDDNRPMISDNPTVVLWTMRFFAVMSIDHSENQAELYHLGCISVVHYVLQHFPSDREIIRYALLTLLNILDHRSGSSAFRGFSAAKAREECLLSGIAECVLRCESNLFPQDHDLVKTAHHIGQLLYSNYS